jgi:hypothetical protein
MNRKWMICLLVVISLLAGCWWWWNYETPNHQNEATQGGQGPALKGSQEDRGKAA